MAHYFRSSATPLNWGTVGSWSSTPSPTYTAVAAIPAATDDVIFEGASASCNVNVAAVCATLNFNSGTGYINTITMTNAITVGSTTAATAASVTLSSGMGISGTGAINTRTNSTVTFRSNGRTWTNALGMNTVATTNTASTIVIADNWTINGTLTIGTGAGHAYTFSGAFNITCNGNLITSNTGAATTNRIAATVGSITTIVLAGNSTWTSPSGQFGIGINVSINAPGNTVTIADGCCYGGAGCVTGSNFSYVAGTVVTQGTFHLMFVASGVNYSINLNGDPSTSATATSSSGVNFNSLSLRTASLATPQSCTLTSNICVVNDFSITSYLTGSKNIANLLGNTAYINKNITINGYSSAGTTIFRLQGTGAWSENNTLTASSFGVTNPVVINTTGAITLSSYVGIRTGSLTYTAGSFVTTGFGIRVSGCTLSGLSAVGTIPYMLHTSGGAQGTTSATITINDSSPLLLDTLTFDGFTSGFAHAYAGTTGWTCNTFTYQHTSTASSASLQLLNPLTYKVNNSFTFRAYSPSTASLMQRPSGAVTRSIFTLMPGASQDVYYMGANGIDSSAGQTVWSRKGTITTTLNWNLWDFPKTRFSTFTS